MDTQLQYTVTIPEDTFAQKIAAQYGSYAPEPMVRELLQNSVDAGATLIELTSYRGFLACQDDGKGMTFDAFQKYYLCLNGSYKESGSVGGFGAAKELLSYAWPRWEIRSLDFAVRGRYMTCTRELASCYKGFYNAAYAAPGEEEKLNAWRTENAARQIVKMSHLRQCRVLLNGEELEQGRVFHGAPAAEFEYGKLYAVKKPSYDESAGYLYVRAYGLFMFTRYIGGDSVYYFVITAPSKDVLTENRQSFIGDVDNEIQKSIMAHRAKSEGKTELMPRSKVFFAGFNNVSSETNVAMSPARAYGGIVEVNTSDVYERASDYAVSNRVTVGGKDATTEHVPPVWRAPIALLSESGKPQSYWTTPAGILKPRYAKAAEILLTALREISICLDKPMPYIGLYEGEFAGGVQMNVGSYHLIAIQPDTMLQEDSFVLLDTLIHEITHYGESDHCQQFETARGASASAIAPYLYSVLQSITDVKKRPERRGQYWQ